MRWGCRRARSLPLARTEHEIARAFERVAGLAEGACTGCPFEGVYHPGASGGWVHELLAARLLVADEGLTWADALGRELTAHDVAALRVWKATQARLRASSTP